MDETRFDALTKALLALPTRRRMLGVLGGGALASVGVTALVDVVGQAKGDGHLRRQADRKRRDRQFQCIPAGEKCINVPRNKKDPPPRLCRKKCCETFRVVNKKVGVCCKTNGQGCSSAAECCLGSCSVGICQNEVIQLLPPPCVAVGGACTQSAECCNGLPCSGALCQVPPPPGCAPFGQACTATADCCPTQTGTPVPCSGGLCRFN